MYEIHVSPRAENHIKSLGKREQQVVLDEVEKQFRHQLDKPTRNRKQLEETVVAPWELRVGALRVFYDVNNDKKEVALIAVGKKDHNILRIGGEEISL
ncbi:MAG: type II toxin-antitoxin system RelE/ParE family toxin [Planctomycetes bacterium]|nr:type II toxin-antitoxin system RelE/ParE family toxin [Planctomycetota bacterium]